MRRNDPKTYREMSVPHASTDAAQNAVNAFLDGVTELRKQHRLADVLVIVETNIITQDGDEGTVSLVSHMGDSRKSLPMAARVYGQLKAQHDDDLAVAVRGKR